MEPSALPEVGVPVGFPGSHAIPRLRVRRVAAPGWWWQGNRWPFIQGMGGSAAGWGVAAQSSARPGPLTHGDGACTQPAA